LSFLCLCGQKPDIRQLDSALEKLYASNRFNGSVLYAEQGKVQYKKAFGIEDFRTGMPLKTTSSFNLASVTRQFVCMGILILKEKGKPGLDDNIKKYIPELPYDSIPIRHLMNQTSCLTEYIDRFQRYHIPMDKL
jgi:CubicO group peptidase (beta-lactamase class C family)